MPDVTWAKQQKQCNRHPDEDRDVNRFTETCAGALILQRVEKANKFLRLQFTKPPRADAQGMKAGCLFHRDMRNEGDGRVRVN